ncbi:MAG: protein kinase [Gemmatimonadales bacterium]
MTDSSNSALPQRLAAALDGSFTIEGEIGRGGMGVVYRARDNRLKRRVAIKVLPPELAFQQEIRERFTREAQTAARLQHPHIVPIHTVGEGEGLVYFVMGLVEGEPLSHRMKRRGPLQIEEVRRIMRETADALSAAHAVEIVHRDIKPDNILLEGTRGRVMVTDFGIAKALSGASGATLTGAGVAIGTPSYMSPEQAAGERDIDGRSDIYSLGICAYQMVTGKLPFKAPNVAGILMKQITEPAPLVTSSRRDVPEDLSLAISRCLEKDPQNRWPTADGLRRALESRTVTGYQPTGLGWKAASLPEPPSRRPERTSRERTRPGHRPQSRSRSRRPSGDRALPVRRAGERSPRRRRSWDSEREASKKLVRDTGEPKIVQRMRAQFAAWASVNGGLFLLNIATTQLDPPWFLIPAAGWGIGILSSYAKVWQAGYSWRDVLRRPPAPDSVEHQLASRQGKALRMSRPTVQEFGAHTETMLQMERDRGAILKQLESMPASERDLLPDVSKTIDGLYQRAQYLALTLVELDNQVDPKELRRIDQRLETLESEPDDEERQRRMSLLERQRDSIASLSKRRRKTSRNLESCVLAIQNVRFDLLRLKSANMQEVLGDLTQATQQARALSRDVDNAIGAVDEVKDALRG